MHIIHIHIEIISAIVMQAVALQVFGACVW